MNRLTWMVAVVVTVAEASIAQLPKFEPLRRVFPVEVFGHGAFADFDGDGRIDLLNGAGGYLSPPGGLYLNRPGPRFEAHPGVAAGNLFAYTSALGVGDMDGDGTVDVIHGTSIGWKLYPNPGDGSLTAATAIPLPPPVIPMPYPWSFAGVALGDFDGDGDLDLFPDNICGPPSCPNGTTLMLWRNDGGGMFTPTTAPFAGAFMRTGPSLFLDVDQDLFVGNRYNAGGSRLFLNDGAGNLVGAPPFGLGSNGVTALAKGDVDGNGLPDIVIMAWAPAGMTETLMLNPGGAPFGLFSTTGIPLGTVSNACVDLNGDGSDEIVRSASGTVTVHAFVPGVGVGPALQTFPGNGEYGALHVVDVDQDSDDDVVLIGWPGGRLYVNDGTGLRDIQNSIHAPVLGMAVAAGDVDQDGDNDFIVNNPVMGAPDLRVAVNDGTGAFFPGTSVMGGIPPAGTVGAIALCDLNGDSYPDLYLAASDLTTQDRVYLNLAGTGWSPPVTQALIGSTVAVACGDLDGDLITDVVLGRTGLVNGGPTTMTNMVRLGLGGGSFGPPIGLPGGPARTQAIGLLDIDADGDLDIVEANAVNPNSPSPLSRLYRNNGGGVFSLVPFPGSVAGTVAIGDIDGDQDIDIVMDTVVFANNGSGAFTVAAVVGNVGTLRRLKLADFDQDGDLDIVETNISDQLVVHENIGGMTFAAPVIIARYQYNATLVDALDMDVDGDPDILIQRPEIFFNRYRQLDRRTQARIGGTLQFRLSAAGGGPWYLFASLGQVSIPIPPFGTLGLDASSVALFATGMFGPSGEDVASFVIPNNPAFSGLTAYWQAFFTASVRLTNLEVATGLSF